MRHNAAMLAFALADAATVHEYAADSLYRHNVTGWTDAHIPRTEKPVRFAWMPVVGYQLDADGFRLDGFAARVLA